jgi:integrating conjugative element protein (TIGR03758 family)
MTMDQTMADAFAGGAGFSAISMKTLIVSLTGAAFLLLMVWIVRNLWEDHQNEKINSGEVIAAIVWMSAIVSLIFAVLGLY